MLILTTINVFVISISLSLLFKIFCVGESAVNSEHFIVCNCKNIYLSSYTYIIRNSNSNLKKIFIPKTVVKGKNSEAYSAVMLRQKLISQPTIFYRKTETCDTFRKGNISYWFSSNGGYGSGAVVIANRGFTIRHRYYSYCIFLMALELASLRPGNNFEIHNLSFNISHT